MPYAIMRFEKRKGGPASAIEKHHERKKPAMPATLMWTQTAPTSTTTWWSPDTNTTQRSSPASNRPAEKSEAQGAPGQREVHRHHRHRHTGLPDAAPAGTGAENFERALEFFSREVGAENIFSAVVHMDERTHICTCASYR